jgi:hypothetical protein
MNVLIALAIAAALIEPWLGVVFDIRYWMFSRRVGQ